MEFQPLALPECVLITPTVHSDERGLFYEAFRQSAFDQAIGRAVHFVQENQSHSQQGVLRGLHFQLPPFAQGKLIRVVAGKIFDVAVDVRKDSPTFGQHITVQLSADNRQQLWIPEGFAHGFYTLSETAQVIYKVNRYWSKEHERCLHWQDQTVAIPWPRQSSALLSPKDSAGSPLAACGH